MDELNQKRFFPLSVNPHLEGRIYEDWYHEYLWYQNPLGGLKCCSDTFCAMHYVGPTQLYFLEYMVHHVHPFGFDKNSTEVLPKKLSLEQIVAASDKKGVGTHYVNHEPVHKLEESELFRRK